jgi:chemosensory pili system protein ChpA (sensor histidine kinase/response regulator)
MMAESVNDVATVQGALNRTLQVTEDDLQRQARMTKELQRDLLRTRMVEFESLSERLYRVVRQAAKELSKNVRLDIEGGQTEMDRSVLDRLGGSFEHLLRNCVAHGIELPEQRAKAGKPEVGRISIALRQEGNEVTVVFSDDGAGLNFSRIRAKAESLGMLQPGEATTDEHMAEMIFTPGFSTADQVSEISGRGIGMDVVKSEILGLGGRVTVSTDPGKGTTFTLVLPLTTAVTQIVLVRMGQLTVGVPSSLVEIVQRLKPEEIEQRYRLGRHQYSNLEVDFFPLAKLLQASLGTIGEGRTNPVLVVRSAAQRVAVHVDEILGNQEVVVRNLGPQLSRVPGLAGMSVLASGAVVLIYNPVALASVYGPSLRAAQESAAAAEDTVAPGADAAGVAAVVADTPLRREPTVMITDDSLTVRRVTQRLMQRNGYRVLLAKDGLDALELLQTETPDVMLLDIEMPRMDGFDLMRNLRSAGAEKKLRELPVIMITSRIADKHRQLAAELGVNHYLGKPYNEEELLSLVSRYTKVQVPEQA